MPLTSFQKDVLAVIAGNRSEDSHFAGGLVLNAAEDSPRFSHDFDIFHELAEQVAGSSNLDVSSLKRAGFQVTLQSGNWDEPCSFRKAVVTKGDDKVEIDWAADSAFRFFPIERDPLLGWRLHLFDMATNKALALAARSVTRDYIDIVELHKTYPLPAIIWAACGKDPGYSPMLLLEMMRRFARIHPDKISAIQARQIDQVALKIAWTDMHVYAEEEMTRLADTQPDMPIGVAFVDVNGQPGWIGTDPTLKIHRPSIRGCLPTVHLGDEEQI
ncbi:nucleotidyl transferase AbiEii/AbiGii toxin family protein [Prosthecobacter sp.]|uniref:nucleotidyl transferase AbiEii/AbiGii toxin family protein n=1 Tax=Prosthecobacter sp. TaxID=1965333 RepID=UPI002ABA1975|nr:nucleotidyl transferase AbiEii/AbiGii toxin family protein [Prosthecobacter sp.]MDZ4402690.1 nucleotidyl transferase AbiEii/AbiGii toxin family protein [Prosthecobacter sp.]